MRGPLVYCFEGKDNENDVLSVSLKENSAFTPEEITDSIIGKTVMLKLEAEKTLSGKELYSCKKPESLPCTLKAIPYYLWGNRGENQMRVWMDEI